MEDVQGPAPEGGGPEDHAGRQHRGRHAAQAVPASHRGRGRQQEHHIRPQGLCDGDPHLHLHHRGHLDRPRSFHWRHWDHRGAAHQHGRVCRRRLSDVPGCVRHQQGRAQEQGGCAGHRRRRGNREVWWCDCHRQCVRQVLAREPRVVLLLVRQAQRGRAPSLFKHQAKALQAAAHGGRRHPQGACLHRCARGGAQALAVCGVRDEEVGKCGAVGAHPPEEAAWGRARG
mmetsp:Transcript_31116/g.78104  ORF Transcript_31116/g.78104 Transcript_31116/m.78104 type:complete len:229 (-) Transcript_31116:725-1411(-)